MAIGLRSYRPLITGTTHMASTGHYLATAVSYSILEQGGNATDAGVAAGLTLNVVLPQYTSLGGVAPILVHDAQKSETVSISGLGRWPQAASIDYFNRNHNGELPPGVLRTVTPAAIDGWLAPFGADPDPELERGLRELADRARAQGVRLHLLAVAGPAAEPRGLVRELVARSLGRFERFEMDTLAAGFDAIELPVPRTVVIESPAARKQVEAELTADGRFSASVPIVGGLNPLRIIATASNGAQAEHPLPIEFDETRAVAKALKLELERMRRVRRKHLEIRPEKPRGSQDPAARRDPPRP